MSFGQSTGPSASAKQVQYLLSLVQQAGHEGFRDARHPLGLTQRQAGGKFSMSEASELIERLLADEGPTGDDAVTGSTDVAPATAPSPSPAPALASGPAPGAPRRTAKIADIPAERLVRELERRGYTVTPPA